MLITFPQSLLNWFLISNKKGSSVYLIYSIGLKEHIFIMILALRAQFSVYTFLNQKVKCVDLIETKNFAYLCFFYFTYYYLKNEFCVYSCIFLIIKENIHLMKKCCDSNL